jgi:hypothetical protein
MKKVCRYQRVIRIRRSKDRQHNGQQKIDQQRSTKQYTKKTRRTEQFFFLIFKTFILKTLNHKQLITIGIQK